MGRRRTVGRRRRPGSAGESGSAAGGGILGRRLRRWFGGAIGAAAGLRAVPLIKAIPGAGAALGRVNFRGEAVSLAAGPALVVGATVGAVVAEPDRGVAAAAAVAGLGAGLVGAYDDVAGARAEQRAVKGFRGHLSALRAGRVTSGAVKIAGVGVAALTAAALIGDAGGRRGSRSAGQRLADLALDTAVIAGTANLVNLLDLRPGRALKAGLLLGGPLTAGRVPGAGVAAGAVGAAAGLLPDDLAERAMLGDSGANALGALLGTALAARSGRPGRIATVIALAGLTAASERVSFTRVIARTPGLRELDAFGRRPS